MLVDFFDQVAGEFAIVPDYSPAEEYSPLLMSRIETATCTRQPPGWPRPRSSRLDVSSGVICVCPMHKTQSRQIWHSSGTNAISGKNSNDIAWKTHSKRRIEIWLTSWCRA